MSLCPLSRETRVCAAARRRTCPGSEGPSTPLAQVPQEPAVGSGFCDKNCLPLGEQLRVMRFKEFNLRVVHWDPPPPCGGGCLATGNGSGSTKPRASQLCAEAAGPRLLVGAGRGVCAHPTRGIDGLGVW